MYRDDAEFAAEVKGEWAHEMAELERLLREFRDDLRDDQTQAPESGFAGARAIVQRLRDRTTDAERQLGRVTETVDRILAQ